MGLGLRPLSAGQRLLRSLSDDQYGGGSGQQMLALGFPAAFRGCNSTMSRLSKPGDRVHYRYGAARALGPAAGAEHSRTCCSK
jgi:hypothetical protein